MKQLFFFMLFVFSITANAQISNYYVTKVCYNRWDESMKAWSGWSQWDKTNNYMSTDYSFSFNLSVSAAVIKIEKYYGKITSQSGESFEITLNQRSPVDGYQFYFDNSTVNQHKTYGFSGQQESKEYDFYGSAKIYSKQLNFASLLSGNASGNLTCYIDCPSGKFYMGLEINNKSPEELEDEQEDILKRKREKQKQTNDNIKKIGESLKILLKKN